MEGKGLQVTVVGVSVFWKSSIGVGPGVVASRTVPGEKAVGQLEDQFEALGHRGSWRLVEVWQLEVEVVVPCALFQNLSLQSCQFVLQSLTLAQQASFKPCNCALARASIPC